MGIGKRSPSWPACGIERFVAPLVIDGAMNAPMFLAYLKQCLVPTLKRGDVCEEIIPLASTGRSQTWD
jgi:hypothetical protein